MEYEWREICKLKNGLIIKARFTGREDVIQWVYFKDEEMVSNTIQTITYSQLLIFKEMNDALNMFDLFEGSPSPIDSVVPFEVLWKDRYYKPKNNDNKED